MNQEQYEMGLAKAFAKARQRLDSVLHGRLTKAFTLALDGAVEMTGEREAVVHSGEKRYAVTCKTCECTDFKIGNAPGGRCKHILALCLHVRATEAVSTEAIGKTDHSSLPATMTEAGISVCMKGTLAGMPGTMVTLRGQTMDDIEARAEAVKARLHQVVSGIFDAPELARTRKEPFIPPAVAHLYE